MILGCGKPLKGLKQDVAGTLWLDHSRGRCLVILVELMLLPERQRQSGYDSGVILSGPLWAKIWHCGMMLGGLSYISIRALERGQLSSLLLSECGKLNIYTYICQCICFLQDQALVHCEEWHSVFSSRRIVVMRRILIPHERILINCPYT